VAAAKLWYLMLVRVAPTASGVCGKIKIGNNPIGANPKDLVAEFRAEMLSIVWRRMRFEWPRTVLRVLAIGGVIGTILILEGFLAGFYSQLRTAVVRRGGDLVVTQAGIPNFIGARSILPQVTRLQVEAVEGVAAAHPLTGLSIIYEQNGRRTPILLVVYDSAGGPLDIVEGHPIEGDREIVIDRSIAVKHGLSPGDTITLSDFDFTIAGVSANESSFLTPFAFVNYDDLIDFYFESDIADDIATFPLLSFLTVDVEPGADPTAVARRIEEAVPAADVYAPRDLALRDESLGREMMGPILNLLLVVTYGIGILVVGMFMFAAVSARRRELGVLRALGAPVRLLRRAVLAEAIALTVMALPVGLAIALGVAALMQQLAPVYVLLPAEPVPVVRTIVACLVFAALGALLPVRSLSRVDPSLVFRS